MTLWRPCLILWYGQLKSPMHLNGKTIVKFHINGETLKKMGKRTADLFSANV